MFLLSVRSDFMRAGSSCAIVAYPPSQLLLLTCFCFLSRQKLNAGSVCVSVSVNKSRSDQPLFSSLLPLTPTTASFCIHRASLALGNIVKADLYCGGLADWAGVYDGCRTGFNWCESILGVWQGEQREMLKVDRLRSSACWSRLEVSPRDRSRRPEFHPILSTSFFPPEVTAFALHQGCKWFFFLHFFHIRCQWSKAMWD